MKTQKIVLLESGCHIALSILKKIKEPNADQKQMVEALQRGLDEPDGEDAETMETVAARLFLQPDIQSAFVQQTCSLDREAVSKVAGAYVYGQFLREKFRAFIDKGDGKFAEGSSTTAQGAVTDAFDQIRNKEQK